MMEKQNKVLPEWMTHSELIDKLIDTQVVDPFIVEPQDLMRIYNLLEDLILYDVHSSCFHTSYSVKPIKMYSMASVLSLDNFTASKRGCFEKNN